MSKRWLSKRLERQLRRDFEDLDPSELVEFIDALRESVKLADGIKVATEKTGGIDGWKTTAFNYYGSWKVSVLMERAERVDHEAGELLATSRAVLAVAEKVHERRERQRA